VLTLTPPLDVDPPILSAFTEALAGALAEIPIRGGSPP
jgi:hypothetical protein